MLSLRFIPESTFYTQSVVRSPRFILTDITINATCLPVATQQSFLQGSQSGYANVIDSHTSLQGWRVKITLSPEWSDFSNWKKQHEQSLQVAKKSPQRFASWKMYWGIWKPWLSYSGVGNILSPRGHKCIFPITRGTAVGRKTHLRKRNQGNCLPGKQVNTAKTARTFSEVQQF